MKKDKSHWNSRGKSSTKTEMIQFVVDKSLQPSYSIGLGIDHYIILGERDV